MGRSAYDDGQSREAIVAPKKAGLYDPFRIRYRMATAGEVSAVYEPSSPLNGKATPRAERHAALLASKIDAWDLTDAAGHKIEISAFSIGKLLYNPMNDLQAIVYGDEPCSDGVETHQTRGDEIKNSEAGLPC
jgi:hypothetical protein